MVAFPWYVLVASLLVARVRSGLLHTTGGLVLNRADVSTIHLCHAALRADGYARRGSRRTPLHRWNARLGAVLSRLAESWAYRPARTRRLVAVSAGAGAQVRRHFPRMADGLAVIPNGVDTAHFKQDPSARRQVRDSVGLGHDDLAALFVGGEWDRKGLAVAIEALADAPGWHLLVVGDGDERSYGELAERLGVRPRVHFAGHQPDPAPWFAAADTFVLPSAFESFCLVSLEAAACRLPLLVTPVNGADEVIDEGRTGWFIARSPDTIVPRLIELGASAELRASLGAAAAERAQRFTWDAVVERYERLYAELDPR